jgi:hypothetical protein
LVNSGHEKAAATFHAHLSSQLRQFGFVLIEADLDLWIKQAADGSYYWDRIGMGLVRYVGRTVVQDNPILEEVVEPRRYSNCWRGRS